MKYAVCIPADQTIAYLTANEFFCTIDHKEAKLWDTREEVEKWIKIQQLLSERGFNDEYDIEEVEDEKEFRSREDTW